MNDEQIKVLAEVPKSQKPLFLRAFGGKSRSAGIKAFCLSCVGHIRAEVRNCSAAGCPLHPYRPYQSDQEPD